MTEVSAHYGPMIDTTLRVLTWNLWWRFGPWERRQPLIVEHLRAADADIVCLQEVWRSDDSDQAASLGDALNMQHVYRARRVDDGVGFGNAVLSRWPITAAADHHLPAAGEVDEQRLVIRVDVDGPRGPLQVYTTHFNWRYDHSHVRQEQARLLAGLVAQGRPRPYPAIVCGDLNAVPESEEVRLLTGRTAVPVAGQVLLDAWEVAGDGPGFTLDPVRNRSTPIGLVPRRRIDYILVGWPRQGGAGGAVSCRLIGEDAVDGVWPSDHFGVVADLRY